LLDQQGLLVLDQQEQRELREPQDYKGQLECKAQRALDQQGLLALRELLGRKVQRELLAQESKAQQDQRVSLDQTEQREQQV
jgi:hypothetical protein